METHDDNGNELGRAIKKRRLGAALTLKELAASSGVSQSHLGRIERGERFPSARVLNRIARFLQFEEGEIFTLAGYLSPGIPQKTGIRDDKGYLDPVVAAMLARETVETQRAVIVVLASLKIIARNNS